MGPPVDMVAVEVGAEFDVTWGAVSLHVCKQYHCRDYDCQYKENTLFLQT